MTNKSEGQECSLLIYLIQYPTYSSKIAEDFNSYDPFIPPWKRKSDQPKGKLPKILKSLRNKSKTEPLLKNLKEKGLVSVKSIRKGKHIDYYSINTIQLFGREDFEDDLREFLLDFTQIVQEASSQIKPSEVIKKIEYVQKQRLKVSNKTYIDPKTVQLHFLFLLKEFIRYLEGHNTKFLQYGTMRDKLDDGGYFEPENIELFKEYLIKLKSKVVSPKGRIEQHLHGIDHVSIKKEIISFKRRRYKTRSRLIRIVREVAI